MILILSTSLHPWVLKGVRSGAIVGLLTLLAMGAIVTIFVLLAWKEVSKDDH
jgi:hypothetical protein